MIKANELRVGNRLLKNGIVVTADARTIFDIWESSKEYSPIPITFDGLNGIGFTGTMRRAYKRIGTTSLTMYVDKGGQFTIEDQDWYSEELKRIKYVHEVQNLYFALTGEELQVNL